MNSYKDKTRPNTFSSAALGCGLSLLAALILLALTAAILTRTEDPRAHSWIGRAILLLCGAAAGYTAAKLTGDPPFPAGLLGGAMYIAVVTLASIVSPFKTSFWYIPVTLGCSAFGSVIGGIRRDKSAKMPSFDGKKYKIE